MHDRLVEQEDLCQFRPRIGRVAPRCQVVQFLVQTAALGLDDPVWVNLARRQAEHQFDKELVALVLAGNAGAIPGCQLGLTLRGQTVDVFFRASVLQDAVFAHQAALFEPRQGVVDLRRFDFPDVLPTDQCLKCRTQVITVARLLSQEAENGVSD